MGISEGFKERLDTIGGILLFFTLAVPVIPLAAFGLYLITRAPPSPAAPNPCLEASLVVPDAAICVAFPIVRSSIWPKLVAAAVFSTSEDGEVETNVDRDACPSFIAEARGYGVSWKQLHDVGEAMVYREALLDVAWRQEVGNDFCTFIEAK